jgi:hypothetical protein
MSKEDIVRMSITDLDTGETFETNHQFFYAPDLEISAIVKVGKVHHVVLPNGSLEISIDGLGLDHIGSVFNVKIMFFPDSICEREAILRDMHEDAIWKIQGQYTLYEDSTICVFDPTYNTVSDYLEQELRKVFRINQGQFT